MRITTMEAPHAAYVASLHSIALPNGFLSHLGNEVLARLYSAIERDPDSTVLVAVDHTGNVVGFVAGTLDVRTCYRRVLRHSGIVLGLRAARHALDPKVLRRIFETLTYPLRFRGRSAVSGEPEPGCTAELLAIAVDERARGQSVGRYLVDALEDFFLSRGHKGRYRVVTDAIDSRSNAFYRRIGFSPLGEFENHGHPMSMYVRETLGGGADGASNGRREARPAS